MYESAEKGFSTATDFADWLVKNLNYPFRKSHNVTGKIVLMAEEQNCKLEELHLTDLKKIVPNITKEIFNNISVEDSVKNKKSFGGTVIFQPKMQSFSDHQLEEFSKKIIGTIGDKLGGYLRD